MNLTFYGNGLKLKAIANGWRQNTLSGDRNNAARSA